MGITSEDVRAHIDRGFDVHATHEEKLAQFRRLVGKPITRVRTTPEQRARWAKQDAATLATLAKAAADGKAVPADPDKFRSPETQRPTADQTMGSPENTQ